MTIKTGFQMEAISLSLDKILPSRQLKPGVRESSRFKMIEASVREVGIIEPPLVYPEGKNGKYLLLDGHLRLEILRQLGTAAEVTCLVATDDDILQARPAIVNRPKGPAQRRYCSVRRAGGSKPSV